MQGEYPEDLMRQLREAAAKKSEEPKRTNVKTQPADYVKREPGSTEMIQGVTLTAC